MFCVFEGILIYQKEKNLTENAHVMSMRCIIVQLTEGQGSRINFKRTRYLNTFFVHNIPVLHISVASFTCEGETQKTKLENIREVNRINEVWCANTMIWNQ